uniref:Uncharacterized protein n=1 Tax=Tetranychus urticae TaxID=32264 RepID=T1JVX6_TETUR
MIQHEVSSMAKNSNVDDKISQKHVINQYLNILESKDQQVKYVYSKLLSTSKTVDLIDKTLVLFPLCSLKYMILVVVNIGSDLSTSYTIYDSMPTTNLKNQLRSRIFKAISEYFNDYQALLKNSSNFRLEAIMGSTVSKTLLDLIEPLKKTTEEVENGCQTLRVINTEKNQANRAKKRKDSMLTSDDNKEMGPDLRDTDISPSCVQLSTTDLSQNIEIVALFNSDASILKVHISFVDFQKQASIMAGTFRVDPLKSAACDFSSLSEEAGRKVCESVLTEGETQDIKYICNHKTTYQLQKAARRGYDK